MTDLLFFFDSEDYETPASDEGEMWWAEALSRHRLTGCFNLVGEEARALRERGRRDVLTALARHEIGYHSNLHSAHPVHVELLEGKGWDEGVAAVLASEASGVAEVRALTGQHPATYCKPGSNWAPQVLAAMALLDIPVFCDAPFEWAPGHPLWYCNLLCVGAHTSFDRYFTADPADRPPRLRQDLLALAETRGPGDVLVMYTHPCRLITAAFPSNFSAGRNPPRSAWKPAPVRPRAEIESLMADFDDFLGWVARESSLRVISYRDLARRSRRRNLWLARDGLTALIQAAARDQEPLGTRQLAGEWLSPAEQFGVLLWAAAWQREHGSLPEAVPVRPLLGPDRLAAPTGSGEIRTASLLDEARLANVTASSHGRIPAALRVDGRLLGPGALLTALAAALREPSETIALRPTSELPALAARPDIAGLHFRGTWSILAPEFEAPGILQHARLQTWSARPA